MLLGLVVWREVGLFAVEVVQEALVLEDVLWLLVLEEVVGLVFSKEQLSFCCHPHWWFQHSPWVVVVPTYEIVTDQELTKAVTVFEKDANELIKCKVSQAQPASM